MFGRALYPPLLFVIPKVYAIVFIKKEVAFLSFNENLHLPQFTRSSIFVFFQNSIFRIYFLSVIKIYPLTH